MVKLLSPLLPWDRSPPLLLGSCLDKMYESVGGTNLSGCVGSRLRISSSDARTALQLLRHPSSTCSKRVRKSIQRNDCHHDLVKNTTTLLIYCMEIAGHRTLPINRRAQWTEARRRLCCSSSHGPREKPPTRRVPFTPLQTLFLTRSRPRDVMPPSPRLELAAAAAATPHHSPPRHATPRRRHARRSNAVGAEPAAADRQGGP